MDERHVELKLGKNKRVKKIDRQEGDGMRELLEKLLAVAKYYHDTEDRVHNKVVKNCSDCNAIREAEKKLKEDTL